MNSALKWKLIAGFLLVFVAGGMTGAFLGVTQARRNFFEPQRRIMGERLRERLKSQLDLSPEQLAKISPIIDNTATKLDEIRRETGRRVHELIQDSHRQMATNLTDEQRVKLEKIEERHRHWRQRGFRGRPPAPSEHEPEQ